MPERAELEAGIAAPEGASGAHADERQLAAWLLHLAAAALLFWHPALAGILLSLTLLRRKREQRSWHGMRLAWPGGRVEKLLDAVFAAAVSGSLSFGPLSDAAATPLPWLPPLLPLVFATISTLGPTHRRAGGRPDEIRGIARLLLALGLSLTPAVTALVPIAAAHWVLTALGAWGIVHSLALARAGLMHVDSSGVVRNNRLILVGKGSALRNAAAAATATVLDFSLFSTLVGFGWLSPPTATFFGAACGGVLNFTLNRNWTFSATGSGRTMARRYVMVSAASATLNAGLVAALLWFPHQHASIAWLVARGMVFLGWNYPLHRDYVFAHGGSGMDDAPLARIS